MLILRRIFLTAAAVSTLFLLATLILWPVSYCRDVVVFNKGEGETYTTIATAYGRVKVEYFFTGNADEGSAPPPGWNFAARIPEESHWSYLTWNTPDPNFSSFFDAPTYLGLCRYTCSDIWDGIYVPFSYLALLFSILPLLALRSIRRRRKAARVGLCPKCGYDLRAQQAGTGGAVCPECGTPVAR